MNLYTRAIYFKNGDSLIITADELRGVQNAILQGNRWILVQGELISADTVARVGSHHATVEMAVRDQADEDRRLIMAGKENEVDERRRLEAEETARHFAATPEQLERRTREFRSELKDVMYWSDENQECHYV
jgi:hypothetical protein